MQLGTRWSVGAEPPRALDQPVVDAIRAIEDKLIASGAGAAMRWTLTWLERRPVVELDDGTRITVDRDGTVTTTEPVEDDDELEHTAEFADARFDEGPDGADGVLAATMAGISPNPFLSPSPLPYGLPAFGEIRDVHYAEAFEIGMREQTAEIAEIVANPEPATFANTMIPLERSGQTLDRVTTVFWHLSSAHTSPFLQSLEEEWAPRLSAHWDSIILNAGLYERVQRVHETLDADPTLSAEDRYLVERWHTEMTLAGAGLDPAAKAEVAAINERLSILSTKFSTDLLTDSNSLAVHIETADELAGLSDAELSAARRAAEERGLDGYLVTLVLPTGHPWLAQLDRADVRERIMRASRERGGHGGPHDTRETLLEIVRLRARRAKLLGFASHAAAVTADETAGSPERVAELLERLAPIAAANARRERERLQELAGQEVLASGWAYWTEKVRARDFDIDTAPLRPWFEAERVLKDGVFFAAHRLYGLTFTERFDLVGYHPDVRFFDVAEEDGSPVGLFLLDLYARDTKRGGAWMNSLVTTASLLGQDTAIVANNLNVPKPADGEPTLLTFDEVETLFHEFGHALHGLVARVTYSKFAGTSVHRDFVEFPSQVNEMWMLWPEVIRNYARHHETGEPLDEAIVERILASTVFNQGFETSEYLAAAIIDQAWHTLTPEHAEAIDDVVEFEREVLARVGLDDPAVPPRYQSPYFAHIFGGGYDAGYYSYIWSEVLGADTVEWFREHGGLTRQNGERFRRLILGVGGSKDPLEAYREFRGRDADIAPLMERRGLR